MIKFQHLVLRFSPRFIATEKRSYDWCIKNLQNRRKRIELLLFSLKSKLDINKKSKIFEIGTAQGLSLLALAQLGYQAIYGIEPFGPARKISKVLEDDFQVKLNIKNGSAEKIDLPKNSVDLVIAEAVLEHVKNDKKTFLEVYRVLKKGGGFYFTTTSTSCPFQGEIRFFPFFPWYPQNLRLIIINWASRKLPFLVGYGDTPAINWYSRSKIIKIAEEIGFRKVICRWQLLDYSQEKKTFKNFVKLIIGKYRFLNFLGDLLFPGSAYLFIK